MPLLNRNIYNMWCNAIRNGFTKSRRKSMRFLAYCAFPFGKDDDGGGKTMILKGLENQNLTRLPPRFTQRRERLYTSSHIHMHSRSYNINAITLHYSSYCYYIKSIPFSLTLLISQFPRGSPLVVAPFVYTRVLQRYPRPYTE